MASNKASGLDRLSLTISASMPSARTSSRVPARTASSICFAAASGAMPFSIAASLTPRTSAPAPSAFFDTFVRTEPGATTSTFMPWCAVSARTLS